MGSWFQSLGAAVEKALSPWVESILGDGCFSMLPFEERREYGKIITDNNNQERVCITKELTRGKLRNDSNNLKSPEIG